MEVFIVHDIWNPWHGCKKCSEGCENCYMFYLDSLHEKKVMISIKLKQGLNILCQNIEPVNIKLKVVK